MSRTKTTDALPIPLISCPCPSVFSPRGFFALAILSAGAYTPRRFVKKTVSPLGQFDEVKDAVRIPSGGVFLPSPFFMTAFLRTVRGALALFE